MLNNLSGNITKRKQLDIFYLPMTDYNTIYEVFLSK